MFVFFCVDVLCGAKFIAKAVLLVRPLRCLHREDFENFEGHPVGWGTLVGFRMVDWLDVGCYFFWQGMEHGMFFLINFFFWVGGQDWKVGVLFLFVFFIYSMFFLCSSLKIFALILWWWDCSSVCRKYSWINVDKLLFAHLVEDEAETLWVSFVLMSWLQKFVYTVVLFQKHESYISQLDRKKQQISSGNGRGNDWFGTAHLRNPSIELVHKMQDFFRRPAKFRPKKHPHGLKHHQFSPSKRGYPNFGLVFWWDLPSISCLRSFWYRLGDSWFLDGFYVGFLMDYVDWFVWTAQKSHKEDLRWNSLVAQFEARRTAVFPTWIHVQYFFNQTSKM